MASIPPGRAAASATPPGHAGKIRLALCWLSRRRARSDQQAGEVEEPVGDAGGVLSLAARMNRGCQEKEIVDSVLHPLGQHGMFTRLAIS